VTKGEEEKGLMGTRSRKWRKKENLGHLMMMCVTTLIKPSDTLETRKSG